MTMQMLYGPANLPTDTPVDTYCQQPMQQCFILARHGLARPTNISQTSETLTGRGVFRVIIRPGPSKPHSEGSTIAISLHLCAQAACIQRGVLGDRGSQCRRTEGVNDCNSITCTNVCLCSYLSVISVIGVTGYSCLGAIVQYQHTANRNVSLATSRNSL